MSKVPRISAAAALLLLLLQGGPALAQGHAWQVGNNSYHLYFDDLDLQAAAGRAAALARVERVAATLCGGVGVRADSRACETRIVQTAADGPMRGVLRAAMAERAGAGANLAQAR